MCFHECFQNWFQQICIISVSGDCMRWISETCQIVASISLTQTISQIFLCNFWRVFVIWNLGAAAAMVSVLSDPMLEEASYSMATMAVAIFSETLFEIRHEGPNWICDKFYYIPDMYSKVSIIRPGRSRLLEFEKKGSTGHSLETFSKYPDQVV